MGGYLRNKIKAIEMISEICESYCIGRNIHVGDTIIGIKGRVGFEAGGPQLIIKAHHLLEKHTLSKWQQLQKDQLSNIYGMLLHEGNYLDPVMRDIESFFTNTQKNVNGKVFINLHPYRFDLIGIESPNDLMNSSFGDYGEINNNWTAQEAKGFIKISSNAHKINRIINNKS